MEERKGQQSSSQPDKNLAADERPVPSQAEGDLETVEEDLKQKDRKNQGGPKSKGTSKGAGSGH
jgi:hypothetical protein